MKVFLQQYEHSAPEFLEILPLKISREQAEKAIRHLEKKHHVKFIMKPLNFYSRTFTLCTVSNLNQWIASVCAVPAEKHENYKDDVSWSWMHMQLDDENEDPQNFGSEDFLKIFAGILRKRLAVEFRSESDKGRFSKIESLEGLLIEADLES